MKPYTRYFWMQLTDDGRWIDAPWAREDGYEHSDMAVIHMHMVLSTLASPEDLYTKRPRWQLQKFYGLKDA
jgi:hypothetical protein